MNSYFLKRKTYIEIMNFLNDNMIIYPINLKEFLNCSYRQAWRILNDVKEEYNLQSTTVDAQIFKMYLFGE